jgi:hypothetical protein
LPIVTIHGTETKKVSTPQGELRFKIPKWEITGWTDAPAGMKGEEAPKPVKAKAVQPDDLEEF